MYAVGDIVEVRTYYNDMIPKGMFVGLITGIRKYSSPFDETAIYDLLDLDTSRTETAEEFAILGLIEERDRERVPD